jgi:hypothetical protein
MSIQYKMYVNVVSLNLSTVLVLPNIHIDIFTFIYIYIDILVSRRLRFEVGLELTVRFGLGMTCIQLHC